MHKRWTRRRLPVLIFTFFIVLFVDLQLRTSDPPKISVVLDPPAGALPRAIQQAPSAAKDAQRPASGSSSREAGHPTTEGAHVSQPKLKQEDIFIAVKTTGRFHKTRLALLVETWMSRTKAHLHVSD
ncbi:beta-1,3-N-acetylglucosaminyltransferase manic fringe-like [Hippoglossus hippoglossus]|uniref:beta-1,3-N-acetylglucosaminyltransferase manic fringe-like n=1 Tax=Hippoglossus hippoglossus TaxID=8267 RepID=UPI00148DF432|nr:beta-1,3-N-acetylglucosaminyltransferase manic fringe-like [Hippoglossus hippoglossus]